MVSESDTQKIIDVLFPGKTVDNIIELINTKIVPLEFKINKLTCEQNDEINFVFIAMFVDDFNTKPEQSKIIFKEIVNYIIEAGGSVSYNEILQHNNMSETLMDYFFSNKYLITDNDNNIFLSPLAISELEGYLIEKYSSRKCMGCMSVVVHGIKCPSCELYVHGFCLMTYFKNVNSKKCLKCFNPLIVDWSSIEIVNKL